MGALLEKWTRAKSEIKLYDEQLVKIAETALFKKMFNGSAPVSTDSKAELFRTQSKNIFNSLVQSLDVNGGTSSEDHKSPKKRSAQSKDKFIDETFDFIRENATDSLFKKISSAKSATRLDNKDYEVSISCHRTPLVDLAAWQSVIIEGKIPQFVQNLSNYLVKLDYEILLIKNNQITVLIDQNQYSIRITGKSKLF